ncbi:MULTISPECIES: PfkB family carbohydrate kinase [unclassified Rathayibacter]|uniref:PfkB family carbohydrate kinase n=1 Tax=unclassified Rathayibacter TaxID=2609250 RepID=UPI000CE7F743|nr:MULTISPECIES: PfkB family carbohydrate kinase [unclassified Rathayibacter]PPG04428.1 sugar kinase [Rathayibacter sp. AY2B1]PPG68451.1 sugar kinase [Rathayibacter sp. AY1F4]
MLGVLGDLVEDVVVWMDEPLRHGTDTVVSIHRSRGGSAANVAAFASASAYPTRFYGAVGDDPTGNALADDLAGHGVELRLQRRGSTGTIVLLVDRSGERSMLPDRGASLLLTALDPDELRDIELLHIPAYSFDGPALRQHVEASARTATALGIPLSIDASSASVLERFGPDAFLKLMAALRPQFLIANSDEAAVLGLVGPQAGTRLEAISDTIVVLKNGSRATHIANVPHPISVPVSPVSDVRDSTGAGDAFAAGFLTGFLRNRDLRLACKSGHHLAASVLRSPGATTDTASPAI